MAKRKIARSRPSTKKRAPAPRESPEHIEPGESPDPLRLTRNQPFAGSLANQNATVADLLMAAFEAPNGYAGADPETFLRNALLGVADDLDLIGVAANDKNFDQSGLIARTALRVQYRSRVAVELSRRMLPCVNPLTVPEWAKVSS